jgi:hypothetical protein
MRPDRSLTSTIRTFGQRQHGERFLQSLKADHAAQGGDRPTGFVLHGIADEQVLRIVSWRFDRDDDAAVVVKHTRHPCIAGIHGVRAVIRSGDERAIGTRQQNVDRAATTGGGPAQHVGAQDGIQVLHERQRADSARHAVDDLEIAIDPRCRRQRERACLTAQIVSSLAIGCPAQTRQRRRPWGRAAGRWRSAAAAEATGPKTCA